MLADKDAVANLAVKDIERAKKFYKGVLGLAEVDHEGDEVCVFKSGGSTVNVYRSDFAGSNKATAVTWGVGDEIEGLVKTLKAKGVAFEHYDMPGMSLLGEDLYMCGDMKTAWFKDPDGNILNIVNR